MRKRTFLGIMLFVAALLTCIFSDSVLAAKSIKLAHVNAVKQPVNLGCLKFKQLVEDKSNGALNVTVYPAAQLGNNSAILAAVKMGDIQTAITTYPLLGDIFAPLTILVGGYVFKDFNHQKAVLDSPLGKSWEKELISRGGLRILSSIYYGVRQLTTTKVAVKSPADLKGLKIRSVPNPMSQAVITGMGATPTPVPFPELFNALRQGVVDGQENPVNTIWHQKLYELQKYLVLTGHQLISLPLVVNNDFYESLSSEHQKILEVAAKEALDYATQLAINEENSQIENLRQKGMVIIGEAEGLDIVAFRKFVGQVVKERFKDKLGAALFEEITKY